jgi:putative FmdB family regulatory protein
MKGGNMAAYDYRCPGCGQIREVSHSMNDLPVIKCNCGETMHKIVSRCNFSIKGTLAKRRVLDFMAKEGDAKAQLREDFGVHKVTPFQGSTMSEVLKDAKGSGSYIKDQMAVEQAKNEARRNAKLKDWRPKAQKRATGKRAVMREQKAKEAAEKRTIRITT